MSRSKIYRLTPLVFIAGACSTAPTSPEIANSLDSSGGGSSGNGGTSRPNVVIFLVDDMGWVDAGYMGSDLHQTDNIDALSRDGVRFSAAYSASHVSSPTRASILTGKYPATLHLTDWINGYDYWYTQFSPPDWQKYLSLDEVTIAEVLKVNNYKTAHFGKWHLCKDDTTLYPSAQGFDTSIVEWDSGDEGYNQYEGYYWSTNYFAKSNITETQIAQLTCDYIDENHESAFYINVCFNGVHYPLNVHQALYDKYVPLATSATQHTNPLYAAYCEEVDIAIGQVVDKLKELDIYDDTVIIFTSDNGGLEHHDDMTETADGTITDNSPLQGGKGSIYEGGVRVPLIIKDSGDSRLSYCCDTPVISVDFAPTIADLLGISVPSAVKSGWEGVSLAPLVESNASQLPDRNIYFHYPHYHKEGAVPHSVVRNGDWRLVYTFEDEQYRLYNLRDDIGESRDVASLYPDIVSSLSSDLEEWFIEVDAQMPRDQIHN